MFIKRNIQDYEVAMVELCINCGSHHSSVKLYGTFQLNVSVTQCRKFTL